MFDLHAFDVDFMQCDSSLHLFNCCTNSHRNISFMLQFSYCLILISVRCSPVVITLMLLLE